MRRRGNLGMMEEVILPLGLMLTLGNPFGFLEE
jgi:hypothetical protein